MALQITKSVQLQANYYTPDNQTQIAFSSANVSKTGTTNNMQITNQEAYDANKQKVRAEKTEFDNAVYAVEDEISGETDATSTEG